MSFGEAFGVLLLIVVVVIFAAFSIAVLPIVLLVGALVLIIWALANLDDLLDWIAPVIGWVLAGAAALVVLVLIAAVIGRGVSLLLDKRDPSRTRGYCRACAAPVVVRAMEVARHPDETAGKVRPVPAKAGQASLEAVCVGSGKLPISEAEAARLTARTKRRLAAERQEAAAARASQRKKASEEAEGRVVRKAVQAQRLKPKQRLIRTPRDAELVASEWMTYMGFTGVTLTAMGADEGIDVLAKEAVAQVKMEGIPTGRPVIQNALGVAAAQKKRALVFSLGGFLPTAVAWADKANVALFQFDLQGVPEAQNSHAHTLLKGGHSNVRA